MKFLSTILLLITIFTRLHSQDLSRTALIGTWKAVGCQLTSEMRMGLDATGQKKMEQMQAGFIGTIFHFKDNNHFNMKFPNNTPSFMKELEFVNNKKWKITKNSSIVIGSEKDNYSLMEIIVIIKQGKKYFIIDESPFILEVVRL